MITLRQTFYAISKVAAGEKKMIKKVNSKKEKELKITEDKGKEDKNEYLG